jgi:hypothetical protein
VLENRTDWKLQDPAFAISVGLTTAESARSEWGGQLWPQDPVQGMWDVAWWHLPVHGIKHYFTTRLLFSCFSSTISP